MKSKVKTSNSNTTKKMVSKEQKLARKIAEMDKKLEILTQHDPYASQQVNVPVARSNTDNMKMKFMEDGLASPSSKALCRSFCSTSAVQPANVLPVFQREVGFISTTVPFNGYRKHAAEASRAGTWISGSRSIVVSLNSVGDGAVVIVPNLCSMQCAAVFQTDSTYLVAATFPSEYNTLAGNYLQLQSPALEAKNDPYNADSINSASRIFMEGTTTRCVATVRTSDVAPDAREGYVSTAVLPDGAIGWTTGTPSTVVRSIDGFPWRTYDADFLSGDEDIVCTGPTSAVNRTYGVCPTGTTISETGPYIAIWFRGCNASGKYVITLDTGYFACGVDVPMETLPTLVSEHEYFSMYGCLVRAQGGQLSHQEGQRSAIISTMYKEHELKQLSTIPSAVTDVLAGAGKLAKWTFQQLLSAATSYATGGVVR